MRHFCSTTTKPEYLNWKILAHKGLQEQPEGVQKRETKVSRFFVAIQRVTIMGLLVKIMLENLMFLGRAK